MAPLIKVRDIIKYLSSGYDEEVIIKITKKASDSRAELAFLFSLVKRNGGDINGYKNDCFPFSNWVRPNYLEGELNGVYIKAVERRYCGIIDPRNHYRLEGNKEKLKDLENTLLMPEQQEKEQKQ